MMMKFTTPVEKGNEIIKDGSLAKIIETLMAKIKPEAVYFGSWNGVRSGMMFFELTDASQLVEFAEPLFLGANATVEIVPVMTPADLRKGLATVSK
jgi:hypothetical protein